jgi:hypothetical protein
MKSNDARARGPRRNNNNGGRRRPQYRDSRDPENRRDQRAEPPKKVSFWQKILAFFGAGPAKKSTPPARAEKPGGQAARPQGDRRRAAPPERIEVTSPRLYIGNLSYEATENDLSELFNGVGKVQNTEIVTHRDTERSKGFGFVTMLTTEEAVRAVETLHDQDFMGRKLVVTGSRSDGSREPRV